VKPRTLGLLAVVIALVLVGFLFFRLPQPIIELAPERIFSIGPFAVTNTILTAWVMIVLIAVVTILGTRRLALIPSGFQNAFEALIEGFAGLANNVAGEKNGRRFFPVVFILFFYIVLCNWAALTPIFNVIGVTENILEHVEEEAAHDPTHVLAEDEKLHGWIMKKDGLSLVPLFTETDFVEVTVPRGTTFAQRQCVVNQGLARALGRQVPECDAQGRPSAEVLHEDEVYGFIAPFLRGVNTDVNAPLSYAFWSAIFVEFWGVSALGLGYATKFFNFRRLRRGDILNGVIDVFVGFLELISELARLVSFTFRLFGNIFAGEVLLFMMSFLVPFLLVDVFYGLELFVGLIQAFVFAMLTLVFGVMAVSGHGEHHEEGHGAAHGEAEARGAAHA
jgi:F-type H+-transporting ATPase subunit a